jgi:hypothetical protein
MATDFCDRNGVLVVEFMQQRTTMSEAHCETLNKKLIRATQKKRRRTLTYDVMLLHYNACPHTQTAASTQAVLEHFNWELFDHHGYSPHLTLRDYHLLIYQKNRLRSQRFNNNEELMEGVKTWLTRQAYLTQTHKNLFTDKTGASIPAMTTLRNNLSM